MKPPTEFFATIADVTDEEHVNTPGLVQADDFNAEVVVRFLRENGINIEAVFWCVKAKRCRSVAH